MRSHLWTKGRALTEIVDVHDDTMLLLTLGEVSDLVSHSHDLNATLTNIVHHIRGRFQTDVCSVYTLEKDTQELVLSATVGLRDESVDRVRMPLHEGLVGLVAQRKAPVNVEDAPQHPRFRYFPESGEELYHSFLGVPLIQAGLVQGVLVVQHQEPRRYSANEVRMLAAVAAQLAILVANARLTRELSDAVRRESEAGDEPEEPLRLAQIQGNSVSPGFAQGRAMRFEAFDFEDPKLVARTPGSIEFERRLLFEALELGRRDIDICAQHLADLLGEEFGALMHAQRLMLEDRTVQKDLIRLIEAGCSVEQAVVQVCGNYMRAFQKLDNPFFYERIYDIKDVFRRVLTHANPAGDRFEAVESVIVVANEVSLLELFSCDLSRVRGIVVEKGGAYSHVAILSRSLKIPMLTNAHRLLAAVRSGDELFLDGESAVVYINPEKARRDVCLRLFAQQNTPMETDVGTPVPIRLETAVNLLPEVARTVQYGGEAVGLYRSEFLELARRSFPTEEEQLDVYRKILRILNGRPFTLRTLDLRAEKLFGLQGGSHSDQCWEWRLVDKLPHVQDLLRTQLRAALRAAYDGPMRILFPMITTQRQLRCALRLVEEAKQSLAEEGLHYGQEIPVGLMIEVPAAAMMTRLWAPQVDFLAIGSNDLLHSLLGIERNDDSLLHLKTPLDPGYLKIVRRVVRHAHAAGRPVTVCGEAASNSRAMLALYALGVDALCVPPDDLPKARRILREVSLPATKVSVAKQLVNACDVESVEEILSKYFPRIPS